MALYLVCVFLNSSKESVQAQIYRRYPNPIDVSDFICLPRYFNSSCLLFLSEAEKSDKMYIATSNTFSVK